MAASIAQEVWQHLTEQQLLEFYKQRSAPEAAASYLAQALSLPEHRFNARSAIQLDYASHLLMFAKEAGFGPVQTSSLLNVAQQLMTFVMGGASFADAEASLKTLLLQLVSSKPGSDTPQLSPDHIARVARYFASTLFRHYKLYAYVFANEQDHTQYTADPMVETAVIQPFDTALTEEEWQAHHRRVAEEKAAQEAQTAAEAEATAAEEAAAVAAAEAQAAAERRRQELAAKPATLEEAVNHMVAVRLEQEKIVLAAEYEKKEQPLVAKLAELESSFGSAASVLGKTK